MIALVLKYSLEIHLFTLDFEKHALTLQKDQIFMENGQKCYISVYVLLFP
jgi:hypothetical protein